MAAAPYASAPEAVPSVEPECYASELYSVHDNRAGARYLHKHTLVHKIFRFGAARDAFAGTRIGRIASQSLAIILRGSSINTQEKKQIFQLFIPAILRFCCATKKFLSKMH